MGLFDFLKKSKGKKPESSAVQNTQSDGKPENSEEYLEILKFMATDYFPFDPTETPSEKNAAQFETLFTMLSDVFFLEALRQRLEQGWSLARAEIKKASSKEEVSKIVTNAIANSGYEIEQYLNGDHPNCIASASRESLLKAFIAADHYAFYLKEEYTVNLRELKKSIAREMLGRGYTAKKLVCEVGKQFLTLDTIWILYDVDFNHYGDGLYRVPYIGLDGRIYIYTRGGAARYDVVNQIHNKHLGCATIIEASGRQDIIAYLKGFQQMGITSFYLDNSVAKVDIPLEDILDPLPENLLERSNNSLRGMFLQASQYEIRRQKYDVDEIRQEAFIRGSTACRNFERSLCYVLMENPYQAGTTFYTKKALKKAKEMLAEYKLTEKALIAEGDNAFAACGSVTGLAAATMKISGQDVPFVFAFTGRGEAENHRIFSLQRGHNYGVLVMTYDELRPYAMKNGGTIMIDFGLSAYRIRLNERGENKNFEALWKLTGV